MELLEAVQGNRTGGSLDGLIHITADAAQLQARRMLAQLIAAEWPEWRRLDRGDRRWREAPAQGNRFPRNATETKSTRGFNGMRWQRVSTRDVWKIRLVTAPMNGR